MANIISLESILNTYGSLNDLRAPDGLSGDRRTLSTTDALSAILEKAYTADSLANKTFFSGIVMATLPSNYPTFTTVKENLEYLSSIETKTSTESTDQNFYFVYKVHIPEIDPRNILEEKSPNCMSLAQKIRTLPDAVLAGAAEESNMLKAIQPGTLVDVTFANEERFLNPRIVKIGPKLFDINLDGSSIRSKFNGSNSVMLRSEFGKITIQNSRLSQKEQDRYPGGIYEPRTQKAVDLLTKALKRLNLPERWAMLESLHYILEAESGGKVGVPNYRYDYLPGRNPERISRVDLNPETWKEIWTAAREGKTGMAGLPANAPRSKGSTSTGLGQLNRKNVIAYYPNGVSGIGDADAEAYGFVNYIAQIYGDPDTARTMYGRSGTYKLGDYYWLDRDVRNTKRTKGFEEGY